MLITCGYTPAHEHVGVHPIFLSHTSKNDPFVRDLRLKMEQRGYTVVEDSAFRSGDNLSDSVRTAIDRSGHLVAVVSAKAVWVKRELRYAQEIAKKRPGFRVIPLRLPGASSKELRAIFELQEPKPGADLEDWPAELIAIDVNEGAGALDRLMPDSDRRDRRADRSRSHPGGRPARGNRAG